MSAIVDEKVAGLLAQAAERGCCYAPAGEDAERVRRALLRRVEAGTVVSPARGPFVSACVWAGLKDDARTLLVARSLQERHPNWVFCGPTAAAAYGLDVSFALLKRVHVAVPPSGCGSDGSIVLRHGVLRSDGGGIEVAAGLRVTPPLQTVLDTARWADFPRALGVMDSALRTGLVQREELEAFLAEASNRPRGMDVARCALSWADPRSENGGESIARGRMLSLGFARPELQVEVPRVIEHGAPYRADFCWVRADGSVILGELDGTGKYVEEGLMGGRSLEEVLSDENVRGSRFTLYDVALVRFGFSLTEDPAAFAALLDEYGVPRRGSALALPDGVRQVPDWAALRRR
ncbi:hypothetical protein [Thermophilibacter sp.]